MPTHSSTNVNPDELQQFSSLADQWWEPEGQLKTLHHINPVRLHYIREHLTLSQQNGLDIGCGGGILTEALAIHGAIMTGIDLNESAIAVAKAHAHQTPETADILYHTTASHTMAQEQPAAFDFVTCMELLEHVPQPQQVIEDAYRSLRPGGWCFLSTLNRTWQSKWLAIEAAENWLNLIPPGTHHYPQLITPAELASWCEAVGFKLMDIRSLSYNPFTGQAKLGHNVSMNYLMAVQKPIDPS